MKMKWGEARDPGDIFKPECLVEVLQNEVNGPVDPLHVGQRPRNSLFRFF